MVDDHALFRVGLVAILGADPDLEVVAEFNSFDQMKPLLNRTLFDVALVDITLGEDNGFEIVKHLKNARPDAGVIVLSAHKEEFYIINALSANVDGYIHKDVDPSELVVGIKKVLKGEKYYSREISQVLINNIYSKPHQRGVPVLTIKEREVITYLMDGFSSKEVAAKLNVSPRTIETHRANILGKFGLKNTSELIKKVVELKIKL